MVTNGKVTAPINIEDAYDALGIAPSGMYDVAEVCTSSKINKWAKFKPIKHSALGDIEAYRKGLGYGIVMLTNINPSNIASAYASQQTTERLNGWVYDKPTGGSSSPYRLPDFDGYNHNAAVIVTQYAMTNEEVGNAAGYSVSVSMFFKEVADGQLTIADLAEGWYLGLMLYQSSTSYYYVTSNNPITQANISEMGFYATLSTQNMPAGEYTMFPVLCSSPCVWDGNVLTEYANARPSSQVFATIPTTQSRKQVVVSGSPIDFIASVLAQWRQTGTGSLVNHFLHASVNITSIRTGVSITNNNLYLLKNGEVIETKAVDDISGVKSYSEEYYFTSSYQSGATYKMRLSLNGGAYVNEYNIVSAT